MKQLLIPLAIAGLCALPFSSQAAAYKEGDVTNGGSVTGKVSFSGKDESPKTYKISKDNDVCGTGNREIDFVRVENGVLLDTVVYLDKVKTGKAFPAELSEVSLDQSNCEFKPFLQVMKNGTKLAAVNSDPVLHNIHTYEILGRAKKTVFNLSQPKPGTVHKKVKLKRGNAMKIECDAHDFMHGFVFVAKNPYYAIVAEDGSFSIDNVPPGKYKVKGWHGTLKNPKAKVEVKAGESASVDIAFK